MHRLRSKILHKYLSRFILNITYKIMQSEFLACGLCQTDTTLDNSKILAMFTLGQYPHYTRTRRR